MLDRVELRRRASLITPTPIRIAARSGAAAWRSLRTTGWPKPLSEVTYTRARWSPPLGTKAKHELAVCGIFRDEAPYLAEWVTFHRLMGVSRFFLYDNRSVDDWQQELAPELQSGIVDVRPWPDEPGQYSAYSDCLRRHGKAARWIAFLDVDEFLFSPTGRSLPDILRAFSRHPAVVANWRVFGTGGWETKPPGLVIESYLTRAFDHDPVNRIVKSVVFPRMTVLPCRHPHVFTHRGYAVGEDGQRQIGPFRESASAELLRINHYRTKSRDEWMRKLGRPRASNQSWDKETDKVPHDDLEDRLILEYLPTVRDALARRESGSWRTDVVRQV